MSFPDSLRALVEDSSALWGFLVAVAIVLVLTPLVSALAPRIGGIDDRTDRPRVHTQPVPRIGGLAIVVGILVPTSIFVDMHGAWLGILVGTILAALPRPRGRHLGPAADREAGRDGALIALIPVVGYDVIFDHLTLPLIGNHDIGWVAYPITVLWIAGLANLVNLIDGMDALAAGIVSIAAFVLRHPRDSFGRADAAVLAAIVCGSTLAFLRSNYHPAKIFMGDSGALALGFVLATMAVAGRPEDGRDDRARRAAARDGGADPRHVVRGAEAAQVPPAAVGRRPQPLLPPLHADRLLAARDGRVPARLGGAARGATRSCCASSRRARGHWDLGNTLIVRRFGAGRGRRLGLDGLHARDPQVAAPAGAAASSGRRAARKTARKRSSALPGAGLAAR